MKLRYWILVVTAMLIIGAAGAYILSLPSASNPVIPPVEPHMHP